MKALKYFFDKHHSLWQPILLDITALAIAVWVLFQLDAPFLLIRKSLDITIFIIINIFITFLLKGYHILLRYTSLLDLSKILGSVLISCLLFGVYANIQTRIELRYLVLLFYFSITTLVTYRILVRLLFKETRPQTNKTKTLIFGASTNGINAFKAFENSDQIDIISFVDDNPNKVGKTIEGMKVYALGDSLATLIHKKGVQQVLIAIESLSKKRKQDIVEFFTDLKVNIFTIPSVELLANTQKLQESFSPINIEDLLSREEIVIDISKNQKQYKNKNILVTGAAGSIGSEIVRQLLFFKPSHLLLVDIAETPLFHLKNELIKLAPNQKFETFVSSVTDSNFLETLFKLNKIDIVFHAAAYKHVVMLENNPKQAIINNIYGSKLVMDLAASHKVSSCILVSTDKAVNPSNIMGVSKRIAELYASNLQDSETKFITTRFGNVLGSNGSVVPIFKDQIAKGGPVTITHPDITRYFMTIKEACLLVLEAGTMSSGGEVFVFDMGEPVKIKDLAIKMIRLSGYEEEQDIPIVYSGLRPGEKLYEELLTPKETLKPSYNPLIFITAPDLSSPQLNDQIESLISMAKNGENEEDLVRLMKSIVPEFKSMNSAYERLDE